MGHTKKLVLKSILFAAFLISTAFASEIDILHLSFDKALSNSEVEVFIEEQGLHPAALFMWAEGHSYSFRVYDDSTDKLSAKELIKEVKKDLINSIGDGHNNDVISAQSILNATSKEAFLNDSDLQESVNFIISKVNQRKKAIEYIKSNEPLIYGMEFVSSTKHLQTIREHKKVKIGHIRSEDIEYGRKQQQGLTPELNFKNNTNGIKPLIYQGYGHAVYYLKLSSDELWEKLNELSETRDLVI